jgi:hypothetical protein
MYVHIVHTCIFLVFGRGKESTVKAGDISIPQFKHIVFLHKLQYKRNIDSDPFQVRRFYYHGKYVYLIFRK